MLCKILHWSLWEPTPLQWRATLCVVFMGGRQEEFWRPPILSTAEMPCLLQWLFFLSVGLKVCHREPSLTEQKETSDLVIVHIPSCFPYHSLFFSFYLFLVWFFLSIVPSPISPHFSDLPWVSFFICFVVVLGISQRTKIAYKMTLIKQSHITSTYILITKCWKSIMRLFSDQATE